MADVIVVMTGVIDGVVMEVVMMVVMMVRIYSGRDRNT